MAAPLDPAARDILLATRAATPSPPATPERARARRARPTTSGVELPEVRDVPLPLPGRTLRSRHYRPVASAPGTVVFFHGGGFVTGDLDTHDPQARMLAAHTGWSVVSVAYRLAPEHPFPAAFDDAVAAVERVSGDGRPVAVAGSSAGANLAAGAARALAGTAAAPRAQLLVYPLLRDAPSSPSRRAHADGPGLDEATLRWYLRHYLDDGHRDDVRFSPLAGPVPAALAPAVIVAAGHDPLRDDGWVYARSLAEQGVSVVLHDHPTLPHAFWGMTASVTAAHLASQSCCDAFAALLSPHDD